MKRFTNRIIINFSIVIFVVFLSVYFIFNRVAESFIHHQVEQEFALDLLNDAGTSVMIYKHEVWMGLTLQETASVFFDLPYNVEAWDSFPLSIMRDVTIQNYIVFNHRGEFASPNLSNHEVLWINDTQIHRNVFLANYYLENQTQFLDDQLQRVEAGGQVYYLQLITADHFGDEGGRFTSNMRLMPEEDSDYDDEADLERDVERPHLIPRPDPEVSHYPYTVLLFSDVTEIINFKNVINQILLIALTISAVIILTMAITMSIKFNQSIKKLSQYAKTIGYGKFDAYVPRLKYKEFDHLAGDMNHMSEMLNAAEENQKKFFQNASHELRTPLMAIQCHAEGLLADIFKPDESAHIIQSETKKMPELVSSILYLSRLDNHSTTPLKISPVSINDFLKNCCTQIKILSTNRGKSICFNPMDTDIQINIDLKLLERAIINILTNAIRYADKNITLASRVYDKELIISIKNDGAQISKKDLPYIFDRFYKSEGGNTGIGLAITKDIVEKFDGQVVARNLADGVAFIISFPIHIQF